MTRNDRPQWTQGRGAPDAGTAADVIYPRSDVAVEQRVLVNLLVTHRAVFLGLGRERAALIASLAFDASWEPRPAMIDGFGACGPGGHCG